MFPLKLGNQGILYIDTMFKPRSENTYQVEHYTIVIPYRLPIQENLDISFTSNYFIEFLGGNIACRAWPMFMYWYYCTTYAFVICLLMKMIRTITTSNSRNTPTDITLATSGITIALDASFINSGPVML